MESAARLIVWFVVVLFVLQLVQGGWAQGRAWLHAKFIGAKAA